jgi:hypothetical protein
MTMTSRSICVAWLGLVLAALAGEGFAGETVLPEGTAPPPLAAGYFPSRLHEFVWRNWEVIEVKDLAKVVGASVEDVTAIAESMGLPPAAAVPPEMKARGYVTLIRRNWHLLPYDQLLTLVGMTPQQLAFTLREDDFLWVKLGSAKPRCEPLHYAPPDEKASRRAAEIKQVVLKEFGAELRRPAEARFEFVRKLSAPLGVSRSETGVSDRGKAADVSQLRFIYSYFAVYGDPLADPKLDPYRDGLLERLARLGINGVWLHVVLRDLAPGGAAFPEFGAGHEKRLTNLRAIVARAKKHGIGVYLYLNEPRAMPGEFFRNRAEMAGVKEGDFTAMCTSNPAVRQWLTDATAHVFGQVPDLGGAFTITASEGLTNCASHGKWKSCPHCQNRTDAEIIAEVNAAIADGVHRGNPKANVLAWDWGWRDHGDAAEIIARLPRSVWLMSVSEWGLPLDRGGVKTTVNEYSISAVGPGPRATQHWKLAQRAGLKTAAKVQLSNSWELGSLPYLPVMDLVAVHCHNLASAGLDGMMLSWTLGGYPSPNLEIAARLAAKPTPPVGEVLGAIATERYGAAGAMAARQAWATFSAAFSDYPFHADVLYKSPVQIGPANPLYAKKTGYKATMSGFPYDDLDAWRGPYSEGVFTTQFERVAEGWRLGFAPLQAAVDKAPTERRAEALAELRYAKAAAIHFQSVANQAAFVLARNTLAERGETLSVAEERQLRGTMRRRLQSEIMLAHRLFTLAREDSRIGFEATNQYFYLPLDLVEKVINCRWLMGQQE